MRNDLGIFNSNSRMKYYGKGEPMPTQPLPITSQILIKEFDIRATEQIRDFNYKIGNLYGARLQAIRIGVKRSELRQLQSGK